MPAAYCTAVCTSVRPKNSAFLVLNLSYFRDCATRLQRRRARTCASKLQRLQRRCVSRAVQNSEANDESPSPHGDCPAARDVAGARSDLKATATIRDVVRTTASAHQSCEY